jgi:hypothetical protein
VCTAWFCQSTTHSTVHQTLSLFLPILSRAFLFPRVHPLSHAYLSRAIIFWTVAVSIEDGGWMLINTVIVTEIKQDRDQDQDRDHE